MNCRRSTIPLWRREASFAQRLKTNVRIGIAADDLPIQHDIVAINALIPLTIL